MDDEHLQLRDKLAIEILNGLLASEKEGASKGFITMMNSQYDTWRDEGVRKVEELIRSAYKIADLMRKIRLESFT